MNSKEYIKIKLQELLKLYPQLTFFYQFDENVNLHQVLVEPKIEFESNDAFQSDEADFTFKFDNLFFPESIVFISEDSLIKIDSPEFILYSPLGLETLSGYSFDVEKWAYPAGENNYALAA
jgi:hypothetical protein